MNPSLGAIYLGGNRCHFRVWAPGIKKVELELLGPRASFIPLEAEERGYHSAQVEGVAPGTRYRFRLEGGASYPDPASRSQPEGVHGASEVLGPDFPWTDQAWKGLPLRDYVIYEIHVGAYTERGDFDSLIPHLERLKQLGVTALELMPVAQFPGNRNWGYDGVYPYAVQSSYGGPIDLKRLVDHCHHVGLAVVLDVVYNHLGPEGNYLSNFGPYFTEQYRSPWGLALNFDGPGSDEVRHFFIENALQWLRDFHIDALRFDAIHGIIDPSARPFLAELTEHLEAEAAALGRSFHPIAESDLNDVRVLRSRSQGGYGFQAQWMDDFHHSLHTLLSGEKEGYYADFGELSQLAKSYREGFVYTGQYSRHRGRRHGNESKDFPPLRFVAFSQNHDQVGNRMQGDRLSQIVDFEGLKLAAACVLLSPFLPLLFMGEEYGETAPFPYFISHSDARLVKAVREGRQREFSSFRWQGEIPDPQSEETFRSAKLDHALKESGRHATLLEFYRELLRWRKDLGLAGLSHRNSPALCLEREKLLRLEGGLDGRRMLLAFHFGEKSQELALPDSRESWALLLDSSEEKWGGPGPHNPPRLYRGGETLALAPRSAQLFLSPEIPS